MILLCTTKQFCCCVVHTNFFCYVRPRLRSKPKPRLSLKPKSRLGLRLKPKLKESNFEQKFRDRLQKTSRIFGTGSNTIHNHTIPIFSYIHFQYQIWDTIQAFASSLSGALSTSAVLRGVGVGNEVRDFKNITSFFIVEILVGNSFSSIAHLAIKRWHWYGWKNK
jgi:hypothetical protein